MGLNHIILVGTVDRAPEKRMTPDGLARTNFRLRVERPVRQEGTPPGVDFLSIVANRRLADVAAEFKVGEVVSVEGRLITVKWEEHGQRKSRVDVDASAIQRIGSGSSANLPESEAPAPALIGGPLDEENPEDLDDSIPF